MHSRLSAEITASAKRVVAATSAVLVRDSNGLLDCVGSSVFIEHRTQKFLVTASHVLTENRSLVLLAGGSTTLPINASYLRSVDETLLDVGCVPLTREHVAAFDDVQFIHSDTIGSVDREERQYFILGYRADDHELENQSSTIQTHWSAYAVKSAVTSAYDARSIEGPERLLLMFDPASLYGPEGSVEPEPEPAGLSGSGIWLRGAGSEADRFMAIVESYTPTGRLIYGSGLRALLRMLDGRADE